MNAQETHPRTAARPRLAPLLALLLLAPTVAAAGSLTLETHPAAPTWRDAITVRVSGNVITSCGADVMSLGEPHRVFDASLGWLVDVELRTAPCDVLAPPSTHAFTLTALAEPLPPGEYHLRVRDLASGEQSVVPFTVYRVGTVELLLPPAARSDAPFAIGARGYWSCPWLDLLAVAGNVITLAAGADCAILPPGPSVFPVETEVGPLPAGDYQVVVIDRALHSDSGFPPHVVTGALRVWDAERCVPSDTALCLQGGRFRLSGTWRAFDGRSGLAHARPLPEDETSGLFWFFDEDNVELTVKLLDGCALSGHWWAFVSAGSTVEYELTVTDTADGTTRRYGNALGERPALVADTSALPCTPDTNP